MHKGISTNPGSQPPGQTRRHPVFLLLGEPLALDLVNTLVPPEFGGDLIAAPAMTREWLRLEASRLPAEARNPPDVRQLAALRKALSGLFAAVLDGVSPPAAFLRTVNAASRAGAGYLELEWTASGVRALAHPARRAGKSGPGVMHLAEIARSGIQLLASPDSYRLRRCEGPGCTLLFVATNPQRRWCAPYLCGNRARVARHYRRTRSVAVGAVQPLS